MTYNVSSGTLNPTHSHWSFTKQSTITLRTRIPGRDP